MHILTGLYAYKIKKGTQVWQSMKIAELEKYSLFRYKEPVSSAAIANTSISAIHPTSSSRRKDSRAID